MIFISVAKIIMLNNLVILGTWIVCLFQGFEGSDQCFRIFGDPHWSWHPSMNWVIFKIRNIWFIEKPNIILSWKINKLLSFSYSESEIISYCWQGLAAGELGRKHLRLLITVFKSSVLYWVKSETKWIRTFDSLKKPN